MAEINDQIEEENKLDGSAQAVKLFVGQLPNHFTDNELRALFEPYGQVTDVHVLIDRVTRLPKGCGFVGFATQEAADRAIAGLHDKMCLQQGKKNLQVKYAGKDNQDEQADAAGDWKLFVGMLAKTTNEDRLRGIFEKFGNVKEVYIMRDTSNVSKGCAFVKYSSREHAVAAISGLHEVFKDDNAPRNLTVKFAETKADRDRILKRLPNQQANPHHMANFPIMGQTPYFSQNAFLHNGVNMNMQQMQQQFAPQMHSYGQPNNGRANEVRGPLGANIFVYNVPDSFSDSDMARLFFNAGTVLSSKVFVDKATGKPRGFGFVSFSSPSEAEMAINMFDGYEIGAKKLKVALKKAGDMNQGHYAPY